MSRRSSGAGAIAAQAAQSGGAFVLQVLASRSLGADGFATFALLYGAIVMATAITSGLVGDSLTVLDRRDDAIRAALRTLTAGVVTLASAATFTVALLFGFVSLRQALLFTIATAVFMLADLARRMLMATLRFWHLVIVDVVGLAAALIFLLGARAGGDLGLGAFLAAVAISQGTVVAVAIGFFPAEERRSPPWKIGAVMSVVRFGGWRAIQQFVRPTMLNLARWVVLATAGYAVVGELEAARVYVAPAMLLVQGVGSYLLASYAADKAGPTRVLLARADRAAIGLLVTSTLGGVAAVALIPVLGPIMTAGAYELNVVGVIGWTLYAASCAAVLPYGTLAAVRGRPAGVLGLRILDSALSIGLVVIVIQTTSISPYWMPALLSVGSFVGGLLCRNLLVRPLLDAEPPTGSPKTEMARHATDHTDSGRHPNSVGPGRPTSKTERQRGDRV